MLVNIWRWFALKKVLLENYIVQFLNEATRDERFQELVEILKSKKVQDGDATQKLVIFDKIYKDYRESKNK